MNFAEDRSTGILHTKDRTIHDDGDDEVKHALYAKSAGCDYYLSMASQLSQNKQKNKEMLIIHIQIVINFKIL